MRHLIIIGALLLSLQAIGQGAKMVPNIFLYSIDVHYYKYIFATDCYVMIAYIVGTCPNNEYKNYFLYTWDTTFRCPASKVKAMELFLLKRAQEEKNKVQDEQFVKILICPPCNDCK